MADRHYLDQTGLMRFWSKLKQYFLQKLTNTNNEVISLDNNHLYLRSISGNKTATIDTIVPEGDISPTKEPQDTSLVTEKGISAMIDQAISSAGIPADSTLYKDTKYEGKTLKKTIGSTTSNVVTATTIVNDGISVSYSAPSQKLIINNKCIVVGPSEYSSDGDSGLKFNLDGSSYVLTSTKCNSQPGVVAPTWCAMNKCLKAIRNEASTATSVVDGNKTLAWNTTSCVAKVGNTSIHVKLPANPNTDTKVTSAANHYEPVTENECLLHPTSEPNPYAENTCYELLTGITLDRDSKGHVTGASITSLKLKNTDTKNTTGSTNSNSKLYLVGAASLATSGVTYSKSATYLDTSGRLFNCSKCVINNSATQTLSNKTLSASVLGTTASAGDSSTKLATTAFVTNAVNTALATAQSGAVHFCGVLPSDGVIVTKNNYKKGTYWLVNEDRTCGPLGTPLESGDLVYHTTDKSCFIKEDFTVVQSNLSRITCAFIEGLS